MGVMRDDRAVAGEESETNMGKQNGGGSANQKDCNVCNAKLFFAFFA